MRDYQVFFIAILNGLLVGLEREKAHPDSTKMGVRTFVLISLLGALAGWLSEGLAGVVALGFGLLLIAISFYRAGGLKQADGHNLTTEVAGAVVLALGYAGHRDPVLASFLGPLVALVLVSKGRLHKLSSQIRLAELEAAVVLFLIATGVLGLVADRTIDPWGLFNPRKFGLLVLLLGALEFASYLAVKFFGEKKSAMMVGFLGGIVSSTAVIVGVSRESAQQPELWRRCVTAASAAVVASLVELMVIMGSVSPALLLNVLPGVAAALLVGSLVMAWASAQSGESAPALVIRSPLDLWGVLRLAGLLTVLLIAVGLTQKTFGDLGTHVLAFLAGLFELHGFSLATATLYGQGFLLGSSASLSVALAVSGSFVSKLILVKMTGRGTYSRVMALSLLAMIVAVLGVAWLSGFFSIDRLVPHFKLDPF